MKNLIAPLFVILSIVTIATPTLSSATDAVTDSFLQQRDIIDSLTPSVERIDMARLLVVRNTIDAVIQDVQANRDAKKKDVTFQTLTLIQSLIIQYRFSKVFFGWTTPVSLMSIYTDETADSLSKLKTLSEQMVDDYGFDDSPYTQITANTFRQMQKLMKQAEDLALSPTLKSQLRALWPAIGDVIAVAEQGDRPNAFAKSVPLVQQIRKMYPLFDEVSSSQAGFSVIMELQGLNEFYAEFAQVDQGQP